MLAKRVLVTGGRRFSDRGLVWSTLDAILAQEGIEILIHGATPLRPGEAPRGADWLADEWARARGVPVSRYPADLLLDGKWPAAGPRRNRRMMAASKPDVVVAFPGGPGTRDMTSVASGHKVEVRRIAARKVEAAG